MNNMRGVTCIAFLASLGLSLGGCADTSPAPAASGAPTFYQSLNASDASVDPVAARDMISVYRRNHGLATLTIDPALQDEARAQVDAMARANEVSHTVRGSLASRISRGSTPRVAAVENVSAGYHTLAEAFSGWRESKPHNDNMLNAKVRRMGIATAYVPGSKYKVFWALVMTD
jgi:uncharacterized protein YkwD